MVCYIARFVYNNFASVVDWAWAHNYEKPYVGKLIIDKSTMNSFEFKTTWCKVFLFVVKFHTTYAKQGAMQSQTKVFWGKKMATSCHILRKSRLNLPYSVGHQTKAGILYSKP